MQYRVTAISAFVGFILFVMLTSTNTLSEADPFVEELIYSKDNADSQIIVESGRDNATNYRYLIIDDFSDAPENWFQSDYNDSAWSLGSAPFGDRQIDGIQPNVIWDTTGSSPYNNDVILIRHKFQLSGIVTEAQIEVAFANYCTPYLNGNMVYDDRGGNSHAQEYWNEDGTESLSPSYFNRGENILAVYARDYVGGWGNSNRQWIDLQITGKIFEPTTEPIIFGDTILVGMNGGNYGDSSVSEYIANFSVNGSIINNIFFSEVAAQTSSFYWMEWKPELIGVNRLQVLITCNCDDANQTNNEAQLNVTTLIYALETTDNEEILIVNQSRFFSKVIEVKNSGDIRDNVSLTIADDLFNDWNVQFTPNNFILEPGQIKNVTVTALLPTDLNDGYYNLSIATESQFDFITTDIIVQRGALGDVDWKWTNSTEEEELFEDTNWTKLDFDDSSWKDGKTPFGDDNSETEYNYKTFWDGDNYAYFRHTVDIPDISLYDGGILRINVATNNYGDHYINGIFIFGDIDGGGGHGAEYWNEVYEIYLNYLTEGSNVISSMVYNPQNTQWFDQEIQISYPQSNLWNYKTQTTNIPIYLDATAPTSRVMEEGFYRNSTSFEIKWEGLSNFDDLKGYQIYYLERIDGSWSDWNLIGYYEEESLTFEGEAGVTYRFKSIAIDFNGNLESKGIQDTEILVDVLQPKSTLLLVEGNLGFTNLDGVTIKWKANETNDIQAYLIEYREVGQLDWNDFGSFTSPGEYWFSPANDSTIEIRSRSIDFAGNKEQKIDSDVVITFDRTKPELVLNQLPELIGATELSIAVKTKNENLSDIKLEYARLEEGRDDILIWVPFEIDWISDETLVGPMIDGYTYYFRVNPLDLAGNDYVRNPYEYNLFINNNSTASIQLPVSPLKPIMIGKLRNVEITVDENGDGIFEKSLEEYSGLDLSAMKANQYWVDYVKSQIIFGDGEDGYLPTKNSTLNIVFSAYDLKTTIDITPPYPVENFDHFIEERNNVTITWDTPTDATSFLIQGKDNFTMPWEELDIIQTSGSKSVSYKISNLSDGFHYYRIISVDRMGYTNENMKDDFIRIVIEAEITNTVESKPEESNAIYGYGFAAVMLSSIALYSASRLLSNRDENKSTNGPALVPVEYDATQINIIPNEEDEPIFSVVPGSQFSRKLMFVCNGGCSKEFEGSDNEEEIMCPYCGTLGESPL